MFFGMDRFNKLRKHFNMIAIAAFLLLMHLLMCIFRNGSPIFILEPYDIGEKLLFSLYKRLGETVYHILFYLFLSVIFIAVFLLFRLICLKDYGSFNANQAIRYYVLLNCIFPFFIIGRIFSYLNPEHSFALALYCVCVLLMVTKRYYIIIFSLCALCEFFYPDFIFTYFPAIVLIFIYDICIKSNTEVKKNLSRQKKQKSDFNKSKSKSGITMPVIMCIIVVSVFIIDLILTKNVHSQSSAFIQDNTTLDRTIFYDSIGEFRDGTWNSIIVATFLNYAFAVIPFLCFYTYIWIQALKKTSGKSRIFFYFCLFAEIPALTGLLLFRIVGLWIAGAIFSQTVLLSMLLLKQDKTIVQIMQPLSGQLKNKNIFILLFTVAEGCCFYEMEIKELILRMLS